MTSVQPGSEMLEKLSDMLGPRGFTSDATDMEPWLTDWRGRVRGATAALLSPATTAEVVAIVRLCAQAGIALVPQGGNTSMVAGATPSPADNALLLSLRRMNRMRSIDPLEATATVEAGVVLTDLHEAAAGHDLRFPLSLGAKGSATVGGLVSTNAGGVQVLRFGTMRALVLGIEAVLPDGGLLNGLTRLHKDNRGYDLRQLLIGAEGTLGVVTAATLRLVPAIGTRAVAWVGVATPADALRLLRRLTAAMADTIESFELVPADGVAMVLRHVAGTRAPLAHPAPWNVLIEATAPVGGTEPAAALGEAIMAAIEDGSAIDAALSGNEAQADALWRLREALPEAERLDGMAAKHDIAVPVAAMPGFIVDASAIIEARYPGTRVHAFGHLGDGNVHFNVRPPVGSDARSWLESVGHAVTRDVNDLVVAAGGSISAEHGIGQMKLAEFARLEDPVRMAALRAIKSALDPQGIMNPGKLVPLAPEVTRP